MTAGNCFQANGRPRSREKPRRYPRRGGAGPNSRELNPATGAPALLSHPRNWQGGIPGSFGHRAKETKVEGRSRGAEPAMVVDQVRRRGGKSWNPHHAEERPPDGRSRVQVAEHALDEPRQVVRIVIGSLELDENSRAKGMTTVRQVEH